nr:YdcH family protein [Sphingomonas sp. Y57]
MSDRFFRYLTREHARLEALIEEQRRRPLPDDMEIARLKKAKLAVKDQIACWQADCDETVAA